MSDLHRAGQARVREPTTSARNLIGAPAGRISVMETEDSPQIPSGKRLHNYVKSQNFMGKLTINSHFNSYVKLPEGKLLEKDGRGNCTS